MVSTLPVSGQAWISNVSYIGADYMRRQGGHSRLCSLDYVHLAKGYVHPGFETIGDEEFFPILAETCIESPA